MRTDTDIDERNVSILDLTAKTILSNVFIGIILTADRNFRVGDRIQVGDYIGDVLEKEVIVNHMLPEQKARIEMQIGISYLRTWNGPRTFWTRSFGHTTGFCPSRPRR